MLEDNLESDSTKLRVEKRRLKSWLSIKGKQVDLNKITHQFCSKCQRVMIYNSDDGVCQDER